MVLFGRIVPVMRTFISVPAGMAEMRPVRFAAFTAIGCSAWVSLLSVIGYELGGRWQSVTKVFSEAGYIVAAIAVVGIAAFVWHRLRALRRERDVEQRIHGSAAGSSVEAESVEAGSVTAGTSAAPTSVGNPVEPGPSRVGGVAGC
jgi:hypothetical protein